MKEILLLLLVNMVSISKAQNSPKNTSGYIYQFILGAGIGSGYPLQESNVGAGATMEFILQNQKSSYSLGGRWLQDFKPFTNSNVNNSISSIDLTYGKIFKRVAFFSSFSAGISFIVSTQQGKLLSQSGWFGTSNYEKLTYYNIGFPVSAKIFLIQKKSHQLVKKITGGGGLELFLNLNSKNTFGGINICFQLKKMHS